MHTMPERADFQSVESCVCLRLRSVARTVTSYFDAEMRGHGIRPTQWSILSALKAKKSWSMADLSDRLGMDRTTLVRNLGPLERDELIKSSGRGRGSRVELSITQKGREKIAEAMPAWREAQKKVVGVLGEKRWTSVLDDLEAAAVALSE
jgi:DNA-binding MarR family transcriptional regulator